MEKSYRIKANVGKDQVLNVNLKRDVDLYEVLSLKLSQEKLYKVHSSDYGVIVGRVLANDAFGIPNTKVSVFIPITNADKLRSDIKTLYPYVFVNSYDSNNVRFNTLPEYSTNKCHKPVGTFPSKRLVLDEDLELEIYDKYYKFTTVTNHAGDYMIFGVPVGEQIIHVDLDLSDIGVLSQKPTDFIYKGYDENLFESPSEFKTSTNLSELPQIISEDVSVNVYPFWGDKEENEIAITRKDVNVQYKFEPTCVFLGSIITDSSVNSIDHNCGPSAKMGEASQLTPSEGTIEMIRKTVDDRVEGYIIKGNKLIDGDGIFCYQIPMNLDFVCTDEYGNIVPTDNPTKGIPTRTRVRFRFTLNETDNEALSSHKARYLVPNNPPLYQGNLTAEPHVISSFFEENNDNYYEFGTLTNDECFRDLLWNKVYSIKSYIPRIQKVNTHESKTKKSVIGLVDGEKNQDYLAIKGVNKKGTHGMNPLPFNKLNLNFSIPTFHIMRKMWDDFFNGDWTGFYDDNLSYSLSESPIRRFWSFLNGRQINFNTDAAVEKAIEDSDGLGLDFYNDWLNGCLYFPNWYWYLAPGERNNNKDNEYISQFCDCDEPLVTQGSNSDKDFEIYVKRDSLCVFNNCSLPYNNNELSFNETYYTNYRPKSDIYVKDASPKYFFPYALQKYNLGSRNFIGGIIKKKVNKDNAIVYYYSCGQERYSLKGYSKDETYDFFPNKYNPYVRLFSTDIILLGSLDENDIHGIPKVSVNLPATTSNIPPIGVYKEQVEANGTEYKDATTGDTDIRVNGMSWGQYWFDRYMNPRNPSGWYSAKKFFSGLFFGISPALRTWEVSSGALRRIKGLVPYTLVKSCVNAERICELGVTNDSRFYINVNKPDRVYHTNSDKDGLITKRELLETDTRALFATLNSDKLIGKILSDSTGYKTYKLSYLYPSNFDGRLEKIAPEYTNCSATSTCTKDARNKDYLDFRFGTISKGALITATVNTSTNSGGGNMGGRRGGTRSGTIDITGGGRIENNGTTTTTIVEQVDSVRHFYGEPRKEEDMYYGSSVPRVDYSFPLYENSFYFYFGINADHTAIGEFYKKFIRKCDIEDKKPFNVEIDIESATYCANNDGKIYVTVSEAALPYTVHLYKNGVEEKIIGSDDYETKTFSELSNGDYEVVVEDEHGETISKLVKLVQDKIRLNFTYGSLHDFSSCVSMNSTIEDEDLSECSQSTFVPYSYINLISYINNGITYDINSVTINSKTDKKMVIDIDNDVQVSIELVSDGSIGNVTIENGMLHIDNTFGNFYLTIRQKNCPLINKRNYWTSTKL